MKKILLSIIFLTSLNVIGQSYKFSITGKIQSKKGKNAIEAATIHLEKVKDSSVISYTISDEKGNFSLEGTSYHKNLKLFVSFIGMNSYRKKITLKKETPIDLGTIQLTEESNLLNEVVITSKAPITIKKDTLEFNVKSFKTKKNANVEDLLKKLPGVEVDEEGKITINGKPVNKILVNGKPFFGNDPTITTKNLSKEIIEKVQITDTKSKAEAFSGEKGDANNKTINLTIKKENNKGWFGRISAGRGTDERYEGATMVNRFNNDTRFSVLASTNNINSPGFSFGEIQKMFGGGGSVWFGGNGSFGIGGRRFGGGQGIIRSKTAGATYADVYGKGLDVNVNYFFSGSNSDNNSRNNRAYTLPNRNYFTNSNSNSSDANDNHAIDAELDIEIDSTFLINIRPQFVFNTREGNYTQLQETLNESSIITNTASSSTFSKSDAKNFQNTIDITKKIGAKGSFIKASLTNQVNTTDGEDINNSTIETFGTNPETIIRDQKSINDNELNTIQSRLTYRYPLIDKKLFIDAKYGYKRDEQTNIESTFDFDTATQNYTLFNLDQSSNFNYNDITKTPAVSISYDVKKWRLNFEIGQVIRTLENVDALRPNLSLSKNFKNITLDASFRYKFDSKASVYFDYSLDNNAPNINQLQPFKDITNPTNTIEGNPNLTPSQTHRVYANFNKYNWQKRTGVFAYIGGSITNNQIVSSITIDDNFVRNSSYENADGVYNFWGGARYNKKIKLDSTATLNFRLGTRFNASKNINIVDGIENTTKTNSVTPSFGLAFKWNKMITIEPRYQIAFSNTRYNINTNANQNFTRHTLGIRTRTNVPKKLEWRNNISYNYNPNLVGFNKSAWFWNSTVSYTILKDKGTISLKAYDLLNQNTNARRTATANYIEDAESTVLTQYFMLGFSWKFNTLGKKGKIRNYGMDF